MLTLPGIGLPIDLSQQLLWSFGSQLIYYLFGEATLTPYHRSDPLLNPLGYFLHGPHHYLKSLVSLFPYLPLTSLASFRPELQASNCAQRTVDA